jgi:hypothetical protein
MRNSGNDDKIDDVEDRWGNCKEGGIEQKAFSLNSLSVAAYRAETERFESKRDVCRRWGNWHEHQEAEKIELENVRLKLRRMKCFCLLARDHNVATHAKDASG